MLRILMTEDLIRFTTMGPFFSCAGGGGGGEMFLEILIIGLFKIREIMIEYRSYSGV